MVVDVKIKYLLLLVLTFSLSFLSYAQPVSPATVVDSNPSDQAILDALKGYGIQNISLSSGDGLVRGARNRQIAIFDDGYNAGFGVNEGILFSTGNAQNDITRGNDHLRESFQAQIGTYSDIDLIGIDPDAIRDVVVYKFKVTLEPHTTAIRAEFQFGSEEYPDYVGSVFNDSFGFFIRPASAGATLPDGASVINMARLPQSNLPISINTVNFGYAGTSGSSSYPGLDLNQSAHYIVNGHTTTLQGNKVRPNANPGPFPVHIQYNGLTKLITYDLTGLVGGETYEFKIAIADAGDTQYDSGVFIKKIHGTVGSDMKIVKTSDSPSYHHGDNVTFTLEASNMGPYDTTGAIVTDLLPSGYTYVSHTASKGNYDPISGEWTIGNLQAIHEIVTLEIQATVNSSGDYTNIAVIESDEPDPDLGNNSSRLRPNIFNCNAALGLTDVHTHPNGSLIDTSDDFITFILAPMPPSDIYVAPFTYTVTAKQNGQPINITMIDGSPATNVPYGIINSTPATGLFAQFRTPNGTAGAGDLNVTVTPNFGTCTGQEITIQDPGAVELSCESIDKTLTYTYIVPKQVTELQNIQFKVPKFDEVDAMHLGKVDLKYDMFLESSLLAEEQPGSTGSSNVSFDLSGTANFKIGTGLNNILLGLAIPNIADTFSLPSVVEVPASGWWTGPTDNSNLKTMTDASSNWFRHNLISGLGVAQHPLYINNATTPPDSNHDDNFFKSYLNYKEANASNTYQIGDAELAHFIGTGDLDLYIETLISLASGGTGSVGQSSIITTGGAKLRITYTWNCQGLLTTNPHTIQKTK